MQAAEQRQVPPELRWTDVRKDDVKQRRGERGGIEGGWGGSELFILCVIRWFHVHFSVAYISPVGAQDRTT